MCILSWDNTRITAVYSRRWKKADIGTEKVDMEKESTGFGMKEE